MHDNEIRQLDAELKGLVAVERKGLVAFLRVLDRFDREDGPARLARESLWQYLEETLHLGSLSVWRRIRALELLRKFPEIEAPLEDRGDPEASARSEGRAPQAARPRRAGDPHRPDRADDLRDHSTGGMGFGYVQPGSDGPRCTAACG